MWCTGSAIIWLLHGWCYVKLPAVSVQVLCTPYNSAPVYGVTSFKAIKVGFMCV